MDRGGKRSALGRPVAAAVIVLVLMVWPGGVPALAATDFGQPVAGQRVYDRAGVLSPGDVQGLETRTAAVARAGAPTIVYLQAQAASYGQTEQDARDLMDAWDVQSAPGARDGLVIFVNLQPGDPSHGQVALYAGQQHVRDGSLTQSELRRIFTEDMQPLLAQGQLAAGIAAGLEAAARNLTVGPPPPPSPGPVQQVAGAAARLPLNLLAILAAGWLGTWLWRTWRGRPVAPGPVATVALPPSDLSPAIAGALVAGRVSDQQLEAAILGLAHRGALSIEPEGDKKVQVRLVERDLIRPGFEEAVWGVVADEANPDGVVTARRLPSLRRHWGRARDALARELEARGWFDPVAAARRRPLYLAGAAALVGAVGLGVVALIGHEVWGLLGVALLGAAGVAALVVGSRLRSTTVAGEWEAAPWRGYRAGLAASQRTPGISLDLDEALPYAVALGVTGALSRQLKLASARGYAPAWFTRRRGVPVDEHGFYPYWLAFHAAVGPSSSAGSSGGGASAGGAGAGGGF